MEFEDVNERVEWEARRVAAAFETEPWTQTARPDDSGISSAPSPNTERIVFSGCAEKAMLVLTLVYDALVFDFEIGDYENEGDYCHLHRNSMGDWHCVLWSKYDHIMARGLYRLGVDDEDVLAQLDYPLTAHEKLELRLSLPREFWPQKWLDEEA